MQTKKLALTALIAIAFAVVCLGGPAVIGSSPTPRAPTLIPAERLRVARKRIESGEAAAPKEAPALPADQIARIGAAMGEGYLVKCELPENSMPDGVSTTILQSKRYIQVPTAQGARPLNQYPSSGEVVLWGSFRWSGAGPDRIGTCEVAQGSATIRGTVSRGGEPQTAYLRACGIPVATRDGQFEIELPLGVRCDIIAGGYEIEPSSIEITGDRTLSLELGEPTEEVPLPSFGELASFASMLYYGPDISGPGDYERALSAEGLSPEAREWLEQAAAAERVRTDRFLENNTMPSGLWLLLNGPGLP